MGFRFRKSIKLGGGFRVNLSKSGIGYSWGVKGYTITRTADGRRRQTVSIPGTGISYVHETSGKRKSVAVEPEAEILNATDINAVEVGDISIAESSMYKSLLRRALVAKYLPPLLLIASFFILAYDELWFAATVFASLLGFLFLPPKLKYTFDDEEKTKWKQLRSAWIAVCKSERLSQITLTAKNINARRTAQIKDAVNHVPVKKKLLFPWPIRMNIMPPLLKLTDSYLAILPDGILIMRDWKAIALSYDDISITIEAVGYLENEGVPKDSEVVDYRWAYANNDGSPDARYSNNQQIPIVKYGRIAITSEDGINIQIMCSNERAAESLLNVITAQKAY